MHDVGLADRLRARGVKVVEVAGWKTRGSSTFNPRGAVNHHTAGSLRGNVPSLTICTYGRSDLPGPLCHVLLGRDLVAYVIAAGRANHAGRGGWRGLSGNSSVHGLEIEHPGTGPSPAQLKVAVQIHAAFLAAPGQSRDARMVCQHFEWAPSRKIDFRALTPYTAASFRTAVADALTGMQTGGPAPKPPTHVEDDMPIIIAAAKRPAALLSGNEAVPFADQATLGALNRAGVPTCAVTPGDYDRFMRGFSAATDQQIADVLAQSTMRIAAIQQIEQREEKRDLADRDGS